MDENYSVDSEEGDTEEEVEQAEDYPMFCVKRGETFYKKNGKLILFGDFYLEFKGKILENGKTYWVCSCGTTCKVSGKLQERTIVIPHSAFETRQKFQQLTTEAFDGGTFSLSAKGKVEDYYFYLKKKCDKHLKDYFAAQTIGPQCKEQDYWCLSSEVHVHKGKILQKENHHYFFLDGSCKRYEVFISKNFIENGTDLSDVCKRFIEASSAFKHNSDSFKLATAFVLHRLLNIHNEASWSESSIALLYSEQEERNVGKSSTMDLLVRAQGVQNRRHPSMLSGGDQNQCGASVKLITMTLTKFSLVTMIDDPVTGRNLNELVVQIQNGLTMGSCSSGPVTPTGSLLISSNTNFSERAEGRVLVFKYSKGEFSNKDEEELTAFREFTYANAGFLLAWAITRKNVWEKLFEKVFPPVEKALSTYLPEMQPRWHKGMAAVISTGAIFHGSVGVTPCLEDTIHKVVSQNKVKMEEDIILRLQRSIINKLETDSTNALYWLNPKVKVNCDGSEKQAIGIRSTVLGGFQQVPTKEITAKLKSITDQKHTIPVYFAKFNSSACTLKDITERNKEKAEQVKGWKIPKSSFDEKSLKYITDCCDNKQRKRSQSSASTEDGTMKEDQCLADLVLTFKPLNQQILKDCQDFNSQERDEGDNFFLKLTPNSKKEWRRCLSPEEEKGFKKGYAAATRKRLNDSLCLGSTPSTSSDNQDDVISNVSGDGGGEVMGRPSEVQGVVPDRNKSLQACSRRKGEVQKLHEGFRWCQTDETSRKRPLQEETERKRSKKR